jgi:uncharacterized protein (TIGR00369 family)
MRKQANSEDCFVCGMQNPAGFKLAFHEFPDGSVRSQLSIRSEFQGWPGVVHGGIIASLLDEVTARVYMNDSTQGRLMMTAKLEIRYRKPVKTETLIHLVGYPVEDNGRVATARGELSDENGVVLAEGNSVLVQAPLETIKSMDLGSRQWVMYPDEEVK